VRGGIDITLDGVRWTVRGDDLWLLLETQLRDALCRVFLWMARPA